MRDSQDTPSFEATVRRAFEQLTAEDLPRVAAARGWRLATPAEFEDLLLGHLAGAPGGNRQDCCLVDLILAVELGGRLLAGTLCCNKMLDRLGAPPCPAPADGGPAPRQRH